MKSVELDIKIMKAEAFRERFLGFMFKKNADYAIFFRNCRSVHTFFVRFNLDIVYLDEENRVLKITKSLKPFRIALPVRNLFSILEIPSEMCDAQKRLIFKELADF